MFFPMMKMKTMNLIKYYTILDMSIYEDIPQTTDLELDVWEKIKGYSYTF